MPIYSYRCQNTECKHEWEEVVIGWENVKDELDCPECHGCAKKVPSVNARMKANWSLWAISHN